MNIKIPSISVVAPVYNEEKVLEEFCKRIVAIVSSYTELYEIILVDDGSKDRSLEIIHTLSQKNPHIKCISLSRNFGHASALSAGIDHAESSLVVLIDTDLQDPPEVLPDFFAKWQEGYKVVYGVRRKRKEGVAKRFSYWAFYRLLKSLSFLKDMPMDAGDFSVIDREVVLELRAMPEKGRFLRGLRSWIGFKQCGVPYERASRFAGSTKYSLKKLFQLAFDGIFSFSNIPLRLASFVGCFIALISFLSILILLFIRVQYGVVGISGFTTTIIIILFLGGVQLISVGILGEYIGRIYEEVKQRPVYIIKEKIGIKN